MKTAVYSGRMSKAEYFSLVKTIQNKYSFTFTNRYSDKRKVTGYRTKWAFVLNAVKIAKQINKDFGDLVIASVIINGYPSLCIHPKVKLLNR